MIKALILTAGALIALAPSTQAASGPGKESCVFFHTIHDYRALDRNNLVIWAPGRHNAYLVEVSMPLPDLTWANELAFVDGNHDGRLCSYGMDRIVIADSGFPQRSTITSMKELDEAGLAALEQRYDVKLTRGKKKASAETSTPTSTP